MEKQKKYHITGTFSESNRKRQKHTNTWPLTFLAWYSHCNKTRWG